MEVNMAVLDERDGDSDQTEVAMASGEFGEPPCPRRRGRIRTRGPFHLPAGPRPSSRPRARRRERATRRRGRNGRWLPPTVPRERIAGCPIHGPASASRGECRCSTMSACLTRAPETKRHRDARWLPTLGFD